MGWISKLCTKLPIFADHFCQFFSSLHAQARITWDYFSAKIWNCVQSALVCSAVNFSYIILYKIFLSSKQEAQRYFFSWNPFHENFQRHADQTLLTFWKQSGPAACLYNGALAELLYHDLPQGVAPNDSISYLVTLRNLRKIYTHT